MEVDNDDETYDNDVLTISDVNIDNLPEKYVWMKVKPGTKMENVLRFAKNALDTGETRALLWTGYGNGVVKVISCVETLKREYTLHQITRLCHIQLRKIPKMPQEEPEVTAKKNHPCIHVLQSLDEIIERKENQTINKTLESLKIAAKTSSKSQKKWKNKKQRLSSGGEAIALTTLKKKNKKNKWKKMQS